MRREKWYAAYEWVRGCVVKGYASYDLLIGRWAESYEAFLHVDAL